MTPIGWNKRQYLITRLKGEQKVCDVMTFLLCRFFLSMDKSLFSWKEHILYIYIHWRSPHSLYTLTLNIWWCSIFNISFCSLIRSILQDIYRRIEFNVLYLSSYEDLKSHGKKAVMKEIYLNKFEVDVSYSDDLFLYKIFIKNYTSLS